MFLNFGAAWPLLATPMDVKHFFPTKRTAIFVLKFKESELWYNSYFNQRWNICNK